MWLALKYAVFAGIAIAVNLAAQALVTFLYPGPFELYFSMAAGTLAGLAVKYLLDKRFIFYFKTTTLVDDGRRFLIYSFLGVFTTLIFWGFEVSFDFLFDSLAMRWLGALLGLILGYWTKYRLDKRFVFV